MIITNINEGNITDVERAYRAYLSLLTAIAPKYTPEELYVVRTPKGNWALRIKDTDKTIRILSKAILSIDLVEEKGLGKID